MSFIVLVISTNSHLAMLFQASLKFLDSLDFPFIKIGSGDADNISLIQEAALLNKPLFISTGMVVICI